MRKAMHENLLENHRNPKSGGHFLTNTNYNKYHQRLLCSYTSKQSYLNFESAVRLIVASIGLYVRDTVIVRLIRTIISKDLRIQNGINLKTCIY